MRESPFDFSQIQKGGADVTPVKTGVQVRICLREKYWIPASAGMTRCFCNNVSEKRLSGLLYVISPLRGGYLRPPAMRVESHWCISHRHSSLSLTDESVEEVQKSRFLDL